MQGLPSVDGRLEGHFGVARERMRRASDDHEPVGSNCDVLERSEADRVSDDSEIGASFSYGLDDLVAGALLQLNVDRGLIGEERDELAGKEGRGAAVLARRRIVARETGGVLRRLGLRRRPPRRTCGASSRVAWCASACRAATATTLPELAGPDVAAALEAIAPDRLFATSRVRRRRTPRPNGRDCGRVAPSLRLYEASHLR